MYESLSLPIGGLGIQSEIAGTIWIDDIKLVAPEPQGLVTLYSEHPRAKLHSWLSHISTETSNPFAGKKAIKLQVNNSWGGLTLHSNRPISENDFGAITLAVKTNTPDLDLYIYAVNEDGDRIGLAKPLSSFLHGGAIPSNWQVAWVPIQALIPHPKPGTFVFNGIGIEATAPGTVWVDEVKVREEFKLPLPGGKSWLLTTEVGDKGCNGEIPPLSSHTGANYFSLDFVDISAVNVSESNVPIYASASGRVIFAGIDQSWPGNGTHVVINHDNSTKGQGLETKYLHLRDGSVSLNTGDHVRQGQYLGTLDKSGGNWGKHIHLGFYYNNSGSESVSALQYLLMEGLRLDEYVATCSGGNAYRYFPSSNTIQ